MPEVKRGVVNFIDEKNEIAAALKGILDHLGLQLVKYEEEGQEVETSHGRSYWQRGEVKYTVEKKQ